MSEGGGRGHLCFCEEDDCNCSLRTGGSHLVLATISLLSVQ